MAELANARPHLTLIAAIDALGWRIVEIRPSITGAGTTLWRPTITRVDGNASMTVTTADPDDSLEELVRYAVADAAEAR